jgi:Asp-tRNA(Asn)/Glu-tRNA(Gln) amidotransferase A subunit family amidase
VLGVAWSYIFSVGSAISPTTTRASLLAGKTLCLKDNICVAGIPQVNSTDMVEPWVPEMDATVVTWILEAGGEIIGLLVRICLIPLYPIFPLPTQLTILALKIILLEDRVLVLERW